MNTETSGVTSVHACTSCMPNPNMFSRYFYTRVTLGALLHPLETLNIIQLHSNNKYYNVFQNNIC